MEETTLPQGYTAPLLSQKLCLEKSKTTLGVSLGALRLNKETSWWNEGVKGLKTLKRDAF